MTPEQRKAARERCRAATPGPWDRLWAQDKDFGDGSVPWALGRELPRDWGLFRASPSCHEPDEVTVEMGDPTAFTVADCWFIAHARQDLPAALDEIDRLEALLAGRAGAAAAERSGPA